MRRVMLTGRIASAMHSAATVKGTALDTGPTLIRNWPAVIAVSVITV